MRSDFAKLGVTPGMLASAASRVQFFNANGSTALYADLFAGGPTYGAAQATYGNKTVGQMASGFKAATYLNDMNTTGFARIYLNSQAFAPDVNGNQFGDDWSTLLHELIHATTTLTDPDIQGLRRNFFLIETGGGARDRVFVILYEHGTPVLKLKRVTMGTAELAMRSDSVDLIIPDVYAGDSAPRTEKHHFELERDR